MTLQLSAGEAERSDYTTVLAPVSFHGPWLRLSADKEHKQVLESRQLMSRDRKGAVLS